MEWKVIAQKKDIILRNKYVVFSGPTFWCILKKTIFDYNMSIRPEFLSLEVYFLFWEICSTIHAIWPRFTDEWFLKYQKRIYAINLLKKNINNFYKIFKHNINEIFVYFNITTKKKNSVEFIHNRTSCFNTRESEKIIYKLTKIATTYKLNWTQTQVVISINQCGRQIFKRIECLM